MCVNQRSAANPPIGERHYQIAQVIFQSALERPEVLADM
jgi:hypothetical protein